MKLLILPLTMLFLKPLAAQQNPTMEHHSHKMADERAGFNTLGNLYPTHSAVDIKGELINGVQCHWFTPAKEQAGFVIIYLHGGAYSLGSLQSHQAMVSHIANALNAKTLFIDYALAPEQPFPQGKNDVITVYSEILKRFPKAKLLFIGDSAGGGLTVSSMFYATENNLRLPDGVILISPWINLRCNTSSYDTKQALDPVLTRKNLREFAAYYGQDNLSAADPSKLDFTFFPPLFILVGSNEILFDDSIIFHNNIKAIQPNVTLKEYKDQTHVWPMMDIDSEASIAALSDMATFIKTIVAK